MLTLPVGGARSTERELLDVLSEACRVSPTPCIEGSKGRTETGQTHSAKGSCSNQNATIRAGSRAEQLVPPRTE